MTALLGKGTSLDVTSLDEVGDKRGAQEREVQERGVKAARQNFVSWLQEGAASVLRGESFFILFWIFVVILFYSFIFLP